MLANLTDTLLNGAGSFVLLFLVFLPLERLFARHTQPVFRGEYLNDLAFFAGQYVLWTAPVVAALGALARYADQLPLAELRAIPAGWPVWAQATLAIGLGDLCIYWGHRLAHRVNFLWRFHRVHHTAERLDWIAAYREHPLDNLYTRVIENAPALLLGFPLELVAGLATFRGLWGLFIHSNAKLAVGPFKYILGSPDLHHWHHEIDRSSRCNFANLCPLWDLAFGTYFNPAGAEPVRYGIPDPVPHGYLAQLALPLLPPLARAPVPGS